MDILAEPFCLQRDDYVDWLSGNQLLGFIMIIQKAKQFLRRSGNIDGFNAEIIID